MFLSRASPLGPVFFVAGFIIAYGMTLGDQVLGLTLQPATAGNAPQFELPEIFFVPPSDALVRFLLWLTLAVVVPVALVIVANLLTGRDPARLLRRALAARLATAARFCAGESGAERQLEAQAFEGTAQLRKLYDLAGFLRRGTGRPIWGASLIDDISRLGLLLLSWLRVEGGQRSRRRQLSEQQVQGQAIDECVQVRGRLVGVEPGCQAAALGDLARDAKTQVMQPAEGHLLFQGDALVDQAPAHERQPDRRFGAPVRVKREHLGQDRADRLGQGAGVASDRQAPVHALVDEPRSELEQLVLGLEVVAQRARRPLRLGSDVSDRDAFHAVARDHPPHRCRKLPATLLVIDDFRHALFFSTTVW